jgi:hypothetical protein
MGEGEETDVTRAEAHAGEACVLLDQARVTPQDESGDLLAEAQVHATLASAFALLATVRTGER